LLQHLNYLNFVMENVYYLTLTYIFQEKTFVCQTTERIRPEERDCADVRNKWCCLWVRVEVIGNCYMTLRCKHCSILKKEGSPMQKYLCSLTLLYTPTTSVLPTMSETDTSLRHPSPPLHQSPIYTLVVANKRELADNKISYSSPEAGFLVRAHPNPCLILIPAQIRALLCASRPKFICAQTITLPVLVKKQAQGHGNEG
jgi:hypothetical protein